MGNHLLIETGPSEPLLQITHKRVLHAAFRMGSFATADSPPALP